MKGLIKDRIFEALDNGKLIFLGVFDEMRDLYPDYPINHNTFSGRLKKIARQSLLNRERSGLRRRYVYWNPERR
ncbi:hypothetical protein GF386_00750 [Candidatus Pacearchaeota archaeon]|nr:hypothetical protein [Candidatus Pacearchaeota archaeon]MBD3282787.1 hypothetical protein [Candidatus Pacearchaeota archaeon]